MNKPDPPTGLVDFKVDQNDEILVDPLPRLLASAPISMRSYTAEEAAALIRERRAIVVHQPPPQIVPFMDAKPGDESFVYRPMDADDCYLDEYGWVTELEWFDERDREIRLVRQRWRLVAEDVLALPDPYPDDDEEEEEDDE